MKTKVQLNMKILIMSIEEFKEKYDLIDIRDLKGKYGF